LPAPKSTLLISDRLERQPPKQIGATILVKFIFFAEPAFDWSKPTQNRLFKIVVAKLSKF